MSASWATNVQLTVNRNTNRRTDCRSRILTGLFPFSQECSNNSIYYQATYATSSLNGGSEGPDESLYGKAQSAVAPGTTRLSYRLALPRPTTCPPEIYDLMLECWQLNEHTRPSFRDMSQFLATRNGSTANEQVYA